MDQTRTTFQQEPHQPNRGDYHISWEAGIASSFPPICLYACIAAHPHASHRLPKEMIHCQIAIYLFYPTEDSPLYKTFSSRFSVIKTFFPQSQGYPTIITQHAEIPYSTSSYSHPVEPHAGKGEPHPAKTHYKPHHFYTWLPQDLSGS